jgi:hypothetical protein
MVRCVKEEQTRLLFNKQWLFNMLDATKEAWGCKAWLIEPGTPMFVVKWYNGGELLQVLIEEKIGYIASYAWLNIEKIDV